jgi:hypothetical protein
MQAVLLELVTVRSEEEAVRLVRYPVALVKTGAIATLMQAAQVL